MVSIAGAPWMLSLIVAVLLAGATPDTPSAEGPPAPASKAESSEEPPQAAAKTKKASREDVVCWNETPVGTRFSKRVCARRGEVDERRQRDQDLVRGIRTAPTPNN